jgi:Leucine-rich repeat (LRR) protein
MLLIPFLELITINCNKLDCPLISLYLDKIYQISVLAELNKISSDFIELDEDLPRYINCSRKKISIFPRIMRVFNLVYLRMEHCKLNDISSIVCQKNLKDLNLEYNEIQYLPENINLLKKLRKLNLNYNLIESLPKSFSKLKLNSLQINWNELNSIDEISEIKSLECLSAEYNNINKFPNINNTRIYNIFLNNNQIEILPSIMSEELLMLNLSKNKITHLNHIFAPKLAYLILDANPIESLPPFTVKNLEFISIDIDGEETNIYTDIINNLKMLGYIIEPL